MIYSIIFIICVLLLVICLVLRSFSETAQEVSQHEQKEDTKVHMSASEYLRLIK